MKSILLIGLACMSLGITACKDNYFEEGKYDELLVSSFPVGKVDPNHTWAIFGSATLHASVNANDSRTYRLAVYQEDPRTTTSVTLLADCEVAAGKTSTLSFSFQLAQPTVYLVCYDENNSHVIMTRTVTNGEMIDLDLSSMGDGVVAKINEKDKAFRFCFEDQFPHPGDYDFNDCVIKVSPTVSGKTATVKVSLDAIGSTKQIAAAMRIKGLAPDAVLTATNTFIDYAASYESTRYITPVKNDKGETAFYVDPETGLGKDAANNQINDFVVSLFNDAHWAMSKVDAGGANQYMHSYYYNTISKLTVNDERARVTAPVVMLFTFTLDTEEHAQLFNDIQKYDVFVVEQYSGRMWEVHTYPFKFDQVLKAYENYTDKLTPYINSSTKNYPWALLLPGEFFYPVEWQSICGYTTNTNGKVTTKETTAYKFFRSWAINPSSTIKEVKEWYLRENIEDLDLVWR